MTNEQIAEWVTQRIDQSIRENLPREILITVILVVEVGAGIFLLIYGIRAGGWVPFAAGSACQLAIGWPIAKLLAIRRDNLHLKILPSLIRMADKEDQKELSYKLAEKLMAKL